jgi:hypothetical protein
LRPFHVDVDELAVQRIRVLARVLAAPQAAEGLPEGRAMDASAVFDLQKTKTSLSFVHMYLDGYRP